MNRTIGWLAAAVVVAVGILPGTIVQGALASGGTPSQLVAGDPQVDADPTPTPTPLPDPTPTPSPVREKEAQITALSIIDSDGDPATLDDRVVFDGQWEFAADFGSAEVLSAKPASEGNVPASWLIAYIVDAPIVVTDLLPAGYSLLDVQCAGSDNSVEWSVDGTSVVGTFSGSMPASLACLFIHSVADFAPGTDATPRITLPPTDITGPIAGGYVTGTPLLLLLIGTSVGVLIVRATRRTRWQ